MEPGSVGRWIDGVARRLGQRVSRRAGLRRVAGVGMLVGQAAGVGAPASAAPIEAEVCLNLNKKCSKRSFRCCGKAACRGGRCRCKSGYKRCQGKCIRKRQCCGDCPAWTVCNNGACAGCGGGGDCLMFATSTVTSGSLGGLTGADAFCQNRATAAALPGTYKAWLSSSTAGPADRMYHSPGPYVRTDGKQLAADWAELTSGVIDFALDRDEFGDPLSVLSYDRSWSSTTTAGTPAQTDSDETCLDWQTGYIAYRGYFGSTLHVDGRWTNFTGTTCDFNSRLYCVQQTS